METKLYPLDHILTVTSGLLITSNRMDGVYDILNWMTGDNLYTHQLPRAMDECLPILQREFPEVAAINVPKGFTTQKKIDEWIAPYIEKYGNSFAVPRLGKDDHTYIDPISELAMMMSNAKIAEIFVVKSDNDDA